MHKPTKTPRNKKPMGKMSQSHPTSCHAQKDQSPRPDSARRRPGPRERREKNIMEKPPSNKRRAQSDRSHRAGRSRFHALLSAPCAVQKQQRHTAAAGRGCPRGRPPVSPACGGATGGGQAHPPATLCSPPQKENRYIELPIHQGRKCCVCVCLCVS